MIGHLLTVPEAAELCRVSAATLYKLVRSGELPAVHFGRSVRLQEADLQRYLKIDADEPTPTAYQITGDGA